MMLERNGVPALGSRAAEYRIHRSLYGSPLPVDLGSRSGPWVRKHLSTLSTHLPFRGVLRYGMIRASATINRLIHVKVLVKRSSFINSFTQTCQRKELIVKLARRETIHKLFKLNGE